MPVRQPWFNSMDHKTKWNKRHEGGALVRKIEMGGRKENICVNMIKCINHLYEITKQYTSLQRGNYLSQWPAVTLNTLEKQLQYNTVTTGFCGCVSETKTALPQAPMSTCLVNKWIFP